MVKTNFADGKLMFVASVAGLIPEGSLIAKTVIRSLKIQEKMGMQVIKEGAVLAENAVALKRLRTAEVLLRGSKTVKNIVARSAENVNNELLQGFVKSGGKAKDFFAPYKPGTQVYEFILAEPKKFVRAYDGTSSGLYQRWLDRTYSIEIDPKKFMDTRALPKDYDYYAIIEAKAGTQMRLGISKGGDFDGVLRTGGGLQYEAIAQNMDEYKDIYRIIRKEIPLNDFGN
jgi:hypothetical protein